jgi:hypothetical protein
VTKNEPPITLGRVLSYVPYLLALLIVLYVVAGWFNFGLPQPLLIVAAVVYFVPAMVAMRRQHRQRRAITVLNVLLGWTLIGWAVALVWACTADIESTDDKAQNAAALGRAAPWRGDHSDRRGGLPTKACHGRCQDRPPQGRAIAGGFVRTGQALMMTLFHILMVRLIANELFLVCLLNGVDDIA